MAKNKMNIKYKSKKRERNKSHELTAKDQVKSGVYTVIGIAVFFGIMYLCVLGLEALGVFQEGYTKPASEVEISYDEILVGSMFNRPEKTYYVLFDNFDEYKTDKYINSLVDDLKERVYKVDMSKPENAKYINTKNNPSAKRASEIKINNITLVKVNNGKIVKYLSGSDAIEEYLK